MTCKLSHLFDVLTLLKIRFTTPWSNLIEKDLLIILFYNFKLGQKSSEKMVGTPVAKIDSSSYRSALGIWKCFDNEKSLGDFVRKPSFGDSIWKWGQRIACCQKMREVVENNSWKKKSSLSAYINKVKKKKKWLIRFSIKGGKKAHNRP